MKKLTIEDIEEIEEQVHKPNDTTELLRLVKIDMPRLIADNRRLRGILNKLAGQATEAVS